MQATLQKITPQQMREFFLGNILGNWGGWRAGQMFQKYLEGKQQPDFKVNPMSQDAMNRVATKITGQTIPQMTSQAMNGYTPPPDNLSQNYNFDLKNYFGSKTTPQSIFSDAAHNIYPKWQPQSYDDLIQKNGNGLQSTYGDNPFSKNPTGWTFSWFNRGGD